jgi:Outer membrane protein beta-barrel domain
MSYASRIFALCVIAWSLAVPVRAQERDGARISGFYAGAFGEGDTNIGAGGSAGYRFTPRMGFDFEVLALPDLELDNSGLDGRGVAFLTNFVTEFPSPAAWLTPYVQGGGGVANIRQGSNLERLEGDDRGNRRIPTPVRGNRGPVPTRLDGTAVLPIVARRSDTSLALTAGGGVDFGLWKGLAVGPNITYMKFFGSYQEIDITRVGARASYRF